MNGLIELVNPEWLVGVIATAMTLTPILLGLVALWLVAIARRLSGLIMAVERALRSRPIGTGELESVATNLERATLCLRGLARPDGRVEPTVTADLVARMSLPEARGPLSPADYASRVSEINSELLAEEVDEIPWNPENSREALKADALDAIAEIVRSAYNADDVDTVKAELMRVAHDFQDEVDQGELDLTRPAPSLTDLEERLHKSVSKFEADVKSTKKGGDT